MSLGNKIKELRKNGLSQKGFADIAGVSRAYKSKKKKNGSQPLGLLFL
ncbi:helix-turn-helix transcriptional regulator [Kineothrix alysoides]|nr:hypothetical protein [Kineothrix alysoides]